MAPTDRFAGRILLSRRASGAALIPRVEVAWRIRIFVDDGAAERNGLLGRVADVGGDRPEVSAAWI